MYLTQRGVLLLSLIFSLALPHNTFANSTAPPYVDITVAQDGSGDFSSLTAAINALPMYPYQRMIIYVKNGIYDEKIRVNQDNITIWGENRDCTIIQYSQLRTDWIANKDYIGPAVINIHGDDFVLRNLTVKNTQPKMGEHAFTIYGTGTRTILADCNITSNGGDTVSLWNYKTGMYYHTNCYFEGGVDFVCPRGWCFIRDSQFYERRQTAAIWHAGPLKKSQKLVIRNSSFNGVEGFNLGRHHYEAQFYLLGCTFSSNMADQPIYHVVYEDNPERNRPYFWGDRHYFYNSHSLGKKYSWLRDNLDDAAGSPEPEEITALWTFEDQWNPENPKPPRVKGYRISGKNLSLYFDEYLTVHNDPKLETSTGKQLIFSMGKGREILEFTGDQELQEHDLQEALRIIQGEIRPTRAFLEYRAYTQQIRLPE